MKVLVVDDNPINLTLINFVLDDLNLTYETAENGQQAIHILQNAPAKEPFNLIIMDCQMPVMDGFEASKRIRNGQAGETNRATPIIACTANAMASDDTRYLEAGMNDYVSKPIIEEHLMEKIQRWTKIKGS